MTGMITSTELVKTLAKYEGRDDRAMVLSSSSSSSTSVPLSSSLAVATTLSTTPVANVDTAMATTMNHHSLNNNNIGNELVYLFAHEQDHDVVLTYWAREAGTIATRHDIYCKMEPSRLPVPIYGDQTVLLPVVKSQVDPNAFEAMLATQQGWRRNLRSTTRETNRGMWMRLLYWKYLYMRSHWLLLWNWKPWIHG